MIRIRFLSPERLESAFPWPLWAVGWLAVFRAFLWLAWEPAVSEELLRLLGWKYLLGAGPYLACALGMWRRCRWAAWGAVLLAAADLALLAIAPRSLYGYLVDSEIFPFSIALSLILLLCGGPLGDVAALALAPRLLRATAVARAGRAAERS